MNNSIPSLLFFPFFAIAYISANNFSNKNFGIKFQKTLFLALNTIAFVILYITIGKIFGDNILSIPIWHEKLELRSAAILAFCVLYYFLTKATKKNQAATLSLIAATTFLYVFYVCNSHMLICEGFILIRLFLYSVDSIRPQRKDSLFDFMNYVFFLPTLLSGPLVTPTGFFKNYFKKFELSRFRVTKGFLLISVGLFKVFVISTMLNILYGNYYQYFANALLFMPLLIACCSFYLMIYFSFSGVIDISRGLASLIGYDLPMNFRSPVMSKNLQEHWLRWHISLFKLLRQYIFLPTVMGLNRVSWLNFHLKIVIGVFTVFFVLAVWQGSKMSYFVFSAWHAVGLSVVYFYGVIKNRQAFLKKISEKSKIYGLLSWLITFIYISFGYFFLIADFTVQEKLLRLMVYGR